MSRPRAAVCAALTVFTACLLGAGARAVAEEGDAPDAARVHLVAFARGLVVDPAPMQELGRESARRIAAAAEEGAPHVEADVMVEQVMTREQVLAGEIEPSLSARVFEERLAALARTVSPDDTVVIYTHTHGRKANFESSQPLGGVVLDLPKLRPEHRGTTLWDQYVEWVLAIPAKHVVVLTMACFSGGLVDYLERPAVRARWAGRRAEGRSFVVLTSQNAERPSEPIVKNGRAINPFTYAVERMLRGEADGFTLREGAPRRAAPDGTLTIGELVDYVLHTTATVESERRPNNAAPSVTGSFDREQALDFGRPAGRQ